MATEQERAAGRRWQEWANDTGAQVIRAAELRAQGFGDADMRTLLSMAFAAGEHAQYIACVSSVIVGPVRAWIGPRGELMPPEVFQAWSKAYPDQAAGYEPLR